MHGLGLGLTQYRRYIEHMFVVLPNHPILVPLLPHVSQEILHPRFLRPMSREELTERIAGLLIELGWAGHQVAPDSSDSEEKVTTKEATHASPKGVTMLSHSK